MITRKILKQTILCTFISLLTNQNSSHAMDGENVPQFHFDFSRFPHVRTVSAGRQGNPIVVSSTDSTPVKEGSAGHITPRFNPRAPLFPIGQESPDAKSPPKSRFRLEGFKAASFRGRSLAVARNDSDAAAAQSVVSLPLFPMHLEDSSQSRSFGSDDTVPHVVQSFHRASQEIAPHVVVKKKPSKPIVSVGASCRLTQRTLFGHRVVHNWIHCRTGSDQLVVDDKTVTVMQSTFGVTIGQYIITVANFVNGQRRSTTLPGSFATQKDARSHVEQNLSFIQTIY